MVALVGGLQPDKTVVLKIIILFEVSKIQSNNTNKNSIQNFNQF